MAPMSLILAVYTILLTCSSWSRTVTANSQYVDANFDDIPANALVPEVTPVGIEDGLFFNSFTVANASNLLPDEGTLAHSLPNQIVNGIPERLLNGTAYITSLYAGSKVKYFDLYGFWFGCATDTVTEEVNLPDACTVAVTGYKAGTGIQVGPTKFNFVPAEPAVSPMIFAKLPSTFSGLNKVTLVPLNSTTTSLTQAVGVDNVNYTLYT